MSPSGYIPYRCERKNPTSFRVGMKANTPQLKTKHNQIFKHITCVINCMLELGKYGRMNNMNMCHLLRKAENGLCSDILLREPQECTPVEIRNSVVEVGRSQLTLVIGKFTVSRNK
ncbi:hypothetical protein [Nitrosopumilus ureiphilus]|uniref:hypothetical protein n=1 Tax=Nitrosopumilus ureiphilus TaxID=1470067 RepID=UPI0015CD5A20|nr:hypothetical protein [Nitrosopumilus ureiphilus]